MAVNWDAIGAVGEIVGAGAVVVSLVYLAMQIRTQNNETRFGAMHDISVGYRDTLATVADGEMATIIDKAIDSYDSLSRVEVLRLIAGVGRIFRVWEEAYLLYESGRLNDRTWEPMVRQFNGYLDVEPFRRVWELRKRYYDESFAKYVDSLSREPYLFE